MTKLIAVLLGIFLSILGVLLVVWVNQTTDSAGIVLPFGWDGPHFWMTMSSPNDHGYGLPFAMVDYNKAEGAYYTNNLAVTCNIAYGISIGLFITITMLKIKNEIVQRWRHSCHSSRSGS